MQSHPHARYSRRTPRLDKPDLKYANNVQEPALDLIVVGCWSIVGLVVTAQVATLAPGAKIACLLALME
jgi:hypothetical protein